MTIYATYRHPIADKGAFPGVLLIAGSGPTDRDGNSPLESGPVGEVRTLANWLSQDGVASLRYDKLGSGQTGLGPYAQDLGSIGIQPFEQESVAALRFLASQPGINDKKLGVFGHSEGALFALLLATGHAGSAPPVHALGLFEPLSVRYLNIVITQVDASIESQVSSGKISRALGDAVEAQLKHAVAVERATGSYPTNLSYGLENLLTPSSQTFFYQTDRYDPRNLAASLPAHFPVIVSCSTGDSQVSCAEVDHLVSGLSRAGASTDFVRLHGVDHVLKVAPSSSPNYYTEPLPFSPVLKVAVKQFVNQNL
jgi:alpha-beta hydrolase superfamily lysophospholipase